MKKITFDPLFGGKVSPGAWDRAVNFHGHACPGLALGCRMAFAAAQALGIQNPDEDEEYACVAETDACCVDAVQALWGCTLGKGNLYLKLRGKTALTFFSNNAGQAVRVLWQAPMGKFSSREEAIKHYLDGPAQSLYSIKHLSGNAALAPKKAQIHTSIACAQCGENTAEPQCRLWQGKAYCRDCFAALSPERNSL